jgi:hypothetical protein
LGTHLRPKPRLRVSRHGKPGNFPGKCVPKQGLGNENMGLSSFSSFPSPGLGTHLRPKPRLRVSRHGKPGNFPGKCVPKQGLGNENMGLGNENIELRQFYVGLTLFFIASGSLIIHKIFLTGFENRVQNAE